MSNYHNKNRGGGYHQHGRNKYSNYNRGPSRKSQLEVGQRGFLCTCNNYEKECTKEAMNLLNEYADKLFGNILQEDWRQKPAETSQETSTKEEKLTDKVPDDHDDDEDEEDIAVALKKEIDGLKQEARKPVHEQRFREVGSGAKNVIFICSKVPDPVLLVHTLLTDLKTSKVGRCRFLQRLLPVQVTCRAYLDDISSAAGPLFDKYFAEGNKTFAIIYKARNNSNLSRDSVIKVLADLVSLKNATNHANLSQPQLVVLVEVIKGICCMSVLPEYFELSKYNLLEIVAPPKAEKQEGAECSEPEKCPEGQEAEDDAENLEGSPAKQPKETC